MENQKLFPIWQTTKDQQVRSQQYLWFYCHYFTWCPDSFRDGQYFFWQSTLGSLEADIIVAQMSPFSWWLATMGSWADCIQGCTFVKISPSQEKTCASFFLCSVMPLLQCCKLRQQERNSTHLAIWNQETVFCASLFPLFPLSANLAFSKILIISLLFLHTSWTVFSHTKMSSTYCKSSGVLPSSKIFCTSPWLMAYTSIPVAEASRHTVLLSR